MSAHTILTPDEIGAVIIDMIAAQVPDDLDDLWWAEAFDPQARSRGYSLGYTPAEARAGVWINTSGPECDLRAVRALCRKLVLRRLPTGRSAIAAPRGRAGQSGDHTGDRDLQCLMPS
jgi:hypothetical protein